MFNIFRLFSPSKSQSMADETVNMSNEETSRTSSKLFVRPDGESMVFVMAPKGRERQIVS